MSPKGATGSYRLRGLAHRFARGDSGSATIRNIDAAGNLHRLCVVLAARFEAVRTPAVGDGHGHARVDPLIRWSKRVRFDHSALQFDIRDALAPGGLLLCELPTGTRIGASSVRRGVQLAASHPHLECVPFRDNATVAWTSSPRERSTYCCWLWSASVGPAWSPRSCRPRRCAHRSVPVFWLFGAVKPIPRDRRHQRSERFRHPSMVLGANPVPVYRLPVVVFTEPGRGASGRRRRVGPLEPQHEVPYLRPVSSLPRALNGPQEALPAQQGRPHDFSVSMLRSRARRSWRKFETAAISWPSRSVTRYGCTGSSTSASRPTGGTTRLATLRPGSRSMPGYWRQDDRHPHQIHSCR